MVEIAPAERLRLLPTSPWWGEHRSRYHFAATSVRGQQVLDVACGTGFGCEILADAGSSLVVGVDVHMDMSSRLEDVVLCVGDGTRLPLRSQSFSVVTSFETVEHIQEDEAFVGELARVLKPGGTLFLSTPNGSQSLSGGENPSNPFHVREYAPDELVVLLGKHFRHVDLRGQRTKSYYPVSPYWERDDVMGEDLRTRWKVLAWKVANRLPYRMKDGFSRLIFNRAFYPGEFDFEFSPAHVATGHVLLAICRQ